MNNTPEVKTNFNATKICKMLLKLTFLYFVIQVWAGIMHLVQPIPLSNLSVSFSKGILESWVIIGGFLYFIFAQVLLYAGFAFFTAGVGIFASKTLRLSPKATYWFSLFFWLLTSVLVFLANQILFHWSIFAILPKLGPAAFPVLIATYVLLGLCGFILLLALIGFIEMAIKGLIKPLWLTIVGLMIVGTPALILADHHSMAMQAQAANHPNIIIIGIDSLRPDYTSMWQPNQSNAPDMTPLLNQYLSQATVFERANTVLARTYPSWLSILTGEYPKTSGIRTELPDLRTVNADHTLGNDLQKIGYYTMFSTDDRRFNHITPGVGFDQVIAPKTGFNDFILGTFNDFPLSNLVMNTYIGKILFPYSYANRSAEVTYLPNTYLAMLNRGLNSLPKNQPVFLAVHLTLPHWPFIWADSTIPVAATDTQQDQLFYTYAVARADRQFADLIALLKAHELLNNTLVFVMSDHGQSIGFPNERVPTLAGYEPGQKPVGSAIVSFFTDPTFGHGTDVLSIAQYHTVFAIRGFGLAQKLVPSRIYQQAALIDIKPTILSLLGLPLDKSQGISLLPWVLNPKTPLVHRDIFAETGFTLPGILVADPSVQKALAQGLSYFTVDPKTGAIIIKPQFGALIIKGKQRAVISFPWMLACYPVNNQLAMYVLGNMETHQWTTDLNSPLAQSADAISLKSKLQGFYGSELQCTG